jgi:hypothetical protein
VKSGTQPTLSFIDHSEKIKLWEYTVLVTNTDYSLEALVRYIVSKIIASKPQNSQLLKPFPFALAFDSG